MSFSVQKDIMVPMRDSVRLATVFPDGRDIFLTDGILRARYRNSLAEPEPLAPTARRPGAGRPRRGTGTRR